MKKLRERSGAAMIAVLCILAIFLTLCLSMLLTASVLMQNAENRRYEEQCRISAVTMSKELERALCTPSEEDKSNGIYKYIQENLKTNSAGSWPYQKSDELGHGDNSAGMYREFTLADSDLAGGPGTVSLKMYWEWERDADLGDIVLHMDVTVRKNRSSHTIKSIYGLDDHGGVGEYGWTFEGRS